MEVKELRMISKIVTGICIVIALSSFYKVKNWESKIYEMENPVGSNYTIVKKSEKESLLEYRIIADNYLTPENLKIISEKIVADNIKITNGKKDIVIKLYKNKIDINGFPNIAQVKYDKENKKYTIIPYVQSLK